MGLASWEGVNCDFATALEIAASMQEEANAEKSSRPLFGKSSKARIKPRFPSWIKSSQERPPDAYRSAIGGTRGSLLSSNRLLAISACSPFCADSRKRWASSSFVRGGSVASSRRYTVTGSSLSEFINLHPVKGDTSQRGSRASATSQWLFRPSYLLT